MSNNARVVDGGEIGVAQYLQALAAGIEPDVRMNPVLVKPEGDDRSQVVVLGRVDHAAQPRCRGASAPRTLWPPIEAALRALLAEYELVVIEGAGSPAEINLRSHRPRQHARRASWPRRRSCLVADIDRGGAFAHLYGTWALARRAAERASLARVRPEQVPRRPVAARARARRARAADRRAGRRRAAVARARPARRGRRRAAAAATRAAAVSRRPLPDCVEPRRVQSRSSRSPTCAAVTRPAAARRRRRSSSCPGSKHVAADLAWLRAHGFAEQSRGARRGWDARARHLRRPADARRTRIDDRPESTATVDGLGLLPVRRRSAVTSASSGNGEVRGAAGALDAS